MSFETNEICHPIIEKISTNIHRLNVYVQNFVAYSEKIGSHEDNEQRRNSMCELIQKSNILSKATSDLIKELVALSNKDRRYRIQRERIMDDYMKILNNLQAAQRKAAQKEKTQIKSVTVEDEILSAKGNESMENDFVQKQKLQEQHRIHLNEIKDRQQTLIQLESDINDVNNIFKELSRIVHDHGEIVDSIEANIEHASIHVEQGHTNVQQALYYQKKSFQKKFLLFNFFCCFILILLLFFYLWTQ